MKQQINFRQMGYVPLNDNGRFSQPNNFRDERIEELCRKRTLWSRLL